MNSRWLLLLVLPLLGAVFYGFMQMDESATDAPAASSALPRYTLNEAVLTRFDADGAITMIGCAATVDYFDDHSARASTVDIDLTDRDNKSWNLKSPTAAMPAGDRRIYLEHEVTGTGVWPDSPESLSIDTRQVWIDPSAHSFSSTAPVDIRSPSRTGTAVGFRAEWLKHRLELQNNVKMTYVTKS